MRFFAILVVLGSFLVGSVMFSSPEGGPAGGKAKKVEWQLDHDDTPDDIANGLFSFRKYLAVQNLNVQGSVGPGLEKSILGNYLAGAKPVTKCSNAIVWKIYVGHVLSEVASILDEMLVQDCECGCQGNKVICAINKYSRTGDVNELVAAFNLGYSMLHFYMEFNAQNRNFKNSIFLAKKIKALLEFAEGLGAYKECSASAALEGEVAKMENYLQEDVLFWVRNGKFKDAMDIVNDDYQKILEFCWEVNLGKKHNKSLILNMLELKHMISNVESAAQGNPAGGGA